MRFFDHVTRMYTVARVVKVLVQGYVGSPTVQTIDTSLPLVSERSSLLGV